MFDNSQIQLNERAETLLQLLIRRYIDQGEPVGSRTLSREPGLGLSPATIRNVMSDLEELGLITYRDYADEYRIKTLPALRVPTNKVPAGDSAIDRAPGTFRAKTEI